MNRMKSSKDTDGKEGKTGTISNSSCLLFQGGFGDLGAPEKYRASLFAPFTLIEKVGGIRKGVDLLKYL